MTASAADLAERRAGLVPLTRVTRLETPAAVASLIVVAVHVLDDNFLQPQPGTSAGDHLVSGLVPLAVLLGCAAAYARLRPALQATLALTLGLLGIAIGAGEAGYYSLKGGPSGDDYTGLLAIPAGLLLVCVGAATLWRTRRTDDGLARRYLRRFLLLVAAALVLGFIVFPLSLSYVFTHVSRTGVPPARLGAAHENVVFRTSDGLTLRGWYVPSRNGAAVIAFPGRHGPQKQARMLVRHGYGVLLFDRRGEGKSDGDPNAFGWAMDIDLKGAAAFLQHRPDVEPNRIGGIGLSVGGEMLLQAAAESNVFRAVVSERRRSLVSRESREAAEGGHAVGARRLFRSHRRNRALLQPRTAAESGGSLVPDRASLRVLHLRVARDRRRGEAAQPEVLRRGRRAEADLGDSRGLAHRRDHGAPAGVRTANRRLLRPCAPRLIRSSIRGARSSSATR
jgi:hypothetical protein